MKYWYFSCGWLFLMLAIAGAILPVLPTTPFLIVAAACFAKSSPTMYQWLLRNRVFGPLIKHWRETRSIPKKAKRIALLSMVLAGGWSFYMLELWWLKMLLVGLMMLPFVYVYRLQETETLTEKNTAKSSIN